MAQKLVNLGVAVDPADQGRDPRPAPEAPCSPGSRPPRRTRSPTRTPLWFYLLREAELNGGRLTGVGGRLVAETIHRAMQGSRFSIVRSKAFTPDLGDRGNTFEMTDLLLAAFDGQASGINPLGGA